MHVGALDDHLSVDRTGDLDAPVFEAGHGPRTLPRRVISDVLGLFEEVGEGPGVELSLEELTAVQERLAGRVERAVEHDEELERFL